MVKTCLNSTLDERRFILYERASSCQLQKGDGRTPKTAWKMWRRKTPLHKTAFRNVKPCSWVESCRNSVELAGLIFKISWVWGRRLLRNFSTSIWTTRTHTTKDNKLKIPHTEILHCMGTRNVNFCIIFRPKAVNTVAKWIQLPAISLEYLAMRLRRMETKKQEALIFKKEKPHITKVTSTSPSK